MLVHRTNRWFGGVPCSPLWRYQGQFCSTYPVDRCLLQVRHKAPPHNSSGRKGREGGRERRGEGGREGEKGRGREREREGEKWSKERRREDVKLLHTFWKPFSWSLYVSFQPCDHKCLLCILWRQQNAEQCSRPCPCSSPPE